MVMVKNLSKETHLELRIRSIRRGETMAQYLERALRNQFALEDGRGLEEVPAESACEVSEAAVASGGLI